MKTNTNQLFILGLFMFLPGLMWSQCPMFSVNLFSQDDVDSFRITYPGCKTPRGIIISGTDIVNLDSLSSIDSILDIGLSIFDNNLTDLTDLGNLKYIEGDLQIENSNLASLNGLQSLKYVGGDLSLNSIQVTNLDGLNNLDTIGEDLVLSALPINSINSLSTLKSLGHANGGFQISACDSLTTLAGFPSLDWVSEINIEDMSMLTNIDDLSNIGTIRNIEIQYCPLLGPINIDVDVESNIILDGCPAVTDIAGFNNLGQINSVSLISLASLQAISGFQNVNFIRDLRIQSVGMDSLTGFNTLDSLFELSIEDCENLKSITGFQNTRSLSRVQIQSSEKLEILPAVPNIHVLEQLEIEECGIISFPLNAFSSLKTCASLELTENLNLEEITPFTDLTMVLEELQITGNYKLIDIAGFSGLEFIGRLELENNEALEACCLVSHWVISGVVSVNFNLDDNGEYCSDVFDIFLKCPDQDKDGYIDSEDNCSESFNADQSDEDGDGVGDGCDNCPTIANPNQADSNENGIGDDCENTSDAIIQSIELESGGIIVHDSNSGVMLKAPNGDCYNLKINNVGKIETYKVVCPE